LVDTNFKLDKRPRREPRLPVLVPNKKRKKRAKTNYRHKLPNAIRWAKYWRRVRKCWLRFMWEWIEITIIDRWEGSHGWPHLYAEDNEGHYFNLTYSYRHKMAYLSKKGELYQYDLD